MKCSQCCFNPLKWFFPKEKKLKHYSVNITVQPVATHNRTRTWTLENGRMRYEEPNNEDRMSN